MFEKLYSSITEHADLTDEEWDQCRHSFSPKWLRRRQFLLQEGDFCTRLGFIEKGALFSYSTNEKGGQQVLQFGFEGWWIADLYSFLTNEVSKLNIEALEDSELLMIDQRSEERRVGKDGRCRWWRER